MPSLADSQRAFAGALAEPRAPAPADIARPPGRADTRRFDVYRNNIAVSLADALAATFPSVERLVGAEFFRTAAREYALADPPTSPVLTRYGAGFADFLDAFPPAAGVAYLGDVARLEFARLEAYHAADAEPAPIARLGEIGPDIVGEARLAFHPSAWLVRSRFPVVSIWADVTGAGDGPVDMARPEDALVVRPQLEVAAHVLPEAGADLVARLMAGDTLGEAAEYAAGRHPRFDLAAQLARLFQAGAIIAVTTHRNTGITGH